MSHKTTPFPGHLVSKRPIERQENKIPDTIKLAVQNAHKACKTGGSIKKHNGVTMSCIKARKKFPEYKTLSTVKYDEMPEVFVNGSLVKAKELHAHNEQPEKHESWFLRNRIQCVSP